MVFCRWLSIVCLAVPTVVSAQSAPTWPDTFDSRVQALALIQTLNAAILSSRSATATLEQWCRDHKLADDPTIVADVVRGPETPATAEQRGRLQIGEQEPVKYRRVELRCGTRVLSKAEIWYVPSKLTAEMNRLLETTSTPFGRVVQPLQPYRQTFAAALLWSPLPDGWETRAAAWPKPTGRPLVIPDAIFAHRAVLYHDRAPLAEVNEVYQRQILAFRPPPRVQ